MAQKNPTTENKKWRNVSVVLLLILVAVIFHAYVYGNQNVNVRQGQEKYPLIDIARHLIPQKDFLSTLQPLRIKLRELVASEPNARISVYIEYLNTGANINLLSEDRFIPASLSKVPIAIATMGAIEHGIWSLDQVLTLEEDDRVQVSSSIYANPIGSKFTIRKLLEELLINSDNTAYRILLRNVPESEITGVTEAIGLNDLFNERGEVTAKEYSRIFRTLYAASYLNRESSEYLLELLNEAKFIKFLREPVPEEIPFPHKFGLGPDNKTFNDSGIVYLHNRPYLITVMVEITETASQGLAIEKAAQIMRAISNMSYQFFSTANNQ